MHYANGRAAQVGDLVRGRGYNLKYEFTGILIHAQPEVSACNCQIATMSHHCKVTEKLLAPDIEYGQLDAFVAINPENGEVLPPEVSPDEQVLLKSRPVTMHGDAVTSVDDRAKIDAAVQRAKSGMTDEDRTLLAKAEVAMHDTTKATELVKELDAQSQQ
jgi:hypothetical protein